MKLALGVAYDGSNFHGWQMQTDNVRTIQSCVEQALSTIAGHSVRVFCAGRTDAGVHAREQVIHFNTHRQRPDRAWLIGANRYLPDDISFNWVKQVSADFHARFSAIARGYQYCIYNHPVRSATNYQHQVWLPRKLNIDLMQSAADILVGKRDFSAFRDSQCQAKTPIKTVKHLNISKSNNIIIIDIKADAFLHRMVRNMVGVLVKIGYGDKPVSWTEIVLSSKDRTTAAMTMPAKGLCFVKVWYPHKLLPR